MQRVGQDIEEARILAQTFQRQSDMIAAAKREIAAGVDKTWWVGPAAEQFRAAWTAEYAPALQKMQQSLQEAGREIKKRSEIMEQASR
jgi:uncharacterized protein YukE